MQFISATLRRFTAVALVSLIAFPFAAQAAGFSVGNSGLETTAGAGFGTNITNNKSLPGFVGTYVIAPILGLIGTIIFILFVYAGILWATAQGDEKKVSKAKEIIKNAVMGTVVIILAYVLSATVIGALSGEDSSSSATTSSSGA